MQSGRYHWRLEKDHRCSVRNKGRENSVAEVVHSLQGSHHLGRLRDSGWHELGALLPLSFVMHCASMAYFVPLCSLLSPSRFLRSTTIPCSCLSNSSCRWNFRLSPFLFAASCVGWLGLSPSLPIVLYTRGSLTASLFQFLMAFFQMY